MNCKLFSFNVYYKKKLIQITKRNKINLLILQQMFKISAIAVNTNFGSSYDI